MILTSRQSCPADIITPGMNLADWPDVASRRETASGSGTQRGVRSTCPDAGVRDCAHSDRWRRGRTARESAAGLQQWRQHLQLHRAVNKEAQGNCNLLLQYVAWLMLQGKWAPGCGTRSHSSLFSNPTTRHYRNIAKLQSLLTTYFFSPLEIQKKPTLALF